MRNEDLQRILEQFDPNLEVLVSDDANTDFVPLEVGTTCMKEDSDIKSIVIFPEYYILKYGNKKENENT